MEILEAIDAIDDLVTAGRSKWSGRATGRIDREALRSAIARLRAAISTSLPDVVAPRVAEPIGRLERIWADAPVRGDRVTVNLAAVFDELDEARQLVVVDIRRQRSG